MSLPIALLALLSAAPHQAATRLGVYTYSLETDAGFQDELLDLFRRELGKHVTPFGEISYSRAEADVAVQLLGQGDLTLRLGSGGEPEGYLFEPDDGARRLWALVHVGGYSRAFAIEGSGGRKMSELGKAIADWMNERSTAIRERRDPR